MGFRSVMHAFVPLFLIITPILFFFALRRFFWVKGITAKIQEYHPNRARFLGRKKATDNTSDDVEWGPAFEAGPVFTDSWESGSQQDDDMRLTFTDHDLGRYSREDGQGLSR